MFTGIVEEAGRVERVAKGKRSTKLVIRTGRIVKGLKRGSSLSVNGACLTVVEARKGRLKFDVLNETLRRTNLNSVRKGDLVNLERPLRADARLGGHFVLGHVDGRGKVRRFERDGRDYVLDIEAPATVMKFIVEKGSVAVDGISLTVAKVSGGWFRVWIIPHTREVTNLMTRKRGESVNLEADILGKYIEKLLGGARRRRG